MYTLTLAFETKDIHQEIVTDFLQEKTTRTQIGPDTLHQAQIKQATGDNGRLWCIRIGPFVVKTVMEEKQQSFLTSDYNLAFINVSNQLICRKRF